MRPFINTIVPLEDDLYLVRDYFATGENQSTAIWKTIKRRPDWSRMYFWKKGEHEAREVGKAVIGIRSGASNTFKAIAITILRRERVVPDGSGISKNITQTFPQMGDQNTGDWKVNLLFEQAGFNGRQKKEVICEVPNYFGGIRVTHHPQLTFEFKDNLMKIVGDTVQFEQGSLHASFPALHTSKGGNGNLSRRSTLGKIELNRVGTHCDDTHFTNCLSQAAGRKIPANY